MDTWEWQAECSLGSEVTPQYHEGFIHGVKFAKQVLRKQITTSMLDAMVAEMQVEHTVPDDYTERQKLEYLAYQYLMKALGA